MPLSKQSATLTRVVAWLALTMTAAAQGPGPGRGFHGPNGLPGPGFAGPAIGFGGGRVVANSPYSGQAVTSYSQTLSDGNVITKTACMKVYRDNAGRTREEETPNSATCGATPRMIVIRDPVAGVQYDIDTQNNTYRQFTFKPRPAGANPRGARPPGPNSAQAQTTDLGTQPIAGTGLSARGTQTVRTIPAGEIGNSQPIVVTSTIWYSPDLQIAVQSSRDDPRSGKSTYQLSSISTAEPPDSLFQLPAGLTEQQRPFGRNRGLQ